jgi:formylglycine-generating enzyme required for sulfatase activity
VGDAEAQLFVVQGEQGPPGRDGRNAVELACDATTCSVDRDLDVDGNGSISGDLDVAGGGTFDSLEADELSVATSVWLPECPRGFERDERREDIVLCTNGRDEMVKVGDFWVDRYEASVWSDRECTTGIRAGVPFGAEREDYPGTFPDSGQVSGEGSRLYACSVRDVTPSTWITWFQAQAACAASGKHIITNAEWQAAVAGTIDPGSSSADGPCQTSGDVPRATGFAGSTPCEAGSCISLWGAEDMVGNLWEWAADWVQAGRGWDAGFSDGEYADVWPDGYSADNQDGTWNINGRAFVRGIGWPAGQPAAVLRGGGDWEERRVGAFAYDLDCGSSHLDFGLGFRCAVR